MYLECCSLWIRNMDPREKWREGHKCIWNMWCCRRMLKIKWTDRITKDEGFQRAKEERLLLRILRNRHHSWLGHTIRHNEFVSKRRWRSNIRKKGRGKTSTTIFKASRQKHRMWQLYSKEQMAFKNSRWKAANQSEDWVIRIRISVVSYMFRTAWVYPQEESCICSMVMFYMHRCELSGG